MQRSEEGIMRNQHKSRDVGARLTRRDALTAGLALAAGGALAAGSARPAAAAARASTPAVPTGRFTAAVSAPDDRATAIVDIVRGFMEQYDLKAVIVRATIDGEEVVTEA